MSIRNLLEQNNFILYCNDLISNEINVSNITMETGNLFIGTGNIVVNDGNFTLVDGDLTIDNGNFNLGELTITKTLNTEQTITDTDLYYLKNLTGNIQAQINNLSPITPGTYEPPGDIIVASSTGELITSTNYDSSISINQNTTFNNNLSIGNLQITNDGTSGTLTGQQLSYVIGATSNLQDQINNIIVPGPGNLSPAGDLLVASSTGDIETSSEYGTTISISQSIIPNTGSIDLGSNSLSFNNLYTSNINNVTMNTSDNIIVNNTTGSGYWGQITIKGVFDGDRTYGMLSLENNSSIDGSNADIQFVGFDNSSIQTSHIYAGQNIYFQPSTNGSVQTINYTNVINNVLDDGNSNMILNGNLTIGNLQITNDETTGTLTGQQLSYVIGATSNLQDQINNIIIPGPGNLSPAGDLLVASSTGDIETSSEYGTTISISQSIIPNTGSIDLGSNSQIFDNFYISNIVSNTVNASDNVTVNNNSGSGDWGQIFIEGIYDGNPTYGMLTCRNNSTVDGSTTQIQLTGFNNGSVQNSLITAGQDITLQPGSVNQGNVYITNGSSNLFTVNTSNGQVNSTYNILDDGSGNCSIVGNFYVKNSSSEVAFNVNDTTLETTTLNNIIDDAYGNMSLQSSAAINTSTTLNINSGIIANSSSYNTSQINFNCVGGGGGYFVCNDRCYFDVTVPTFDRFISGCNSYNYDNVINSTLNTPTIYYGLNVGNVNASGGAGITLLNGASPGNTANLYWLGSALVIGPQTTGIVTISSDLLNFYDTSNIGVNNIDTWQNIYLQNNPIVVSDRNFKQNINPISNALNIINDLNPVSFQWNENAKKKNNIKPNYNKPDEKPDTRTYFGVLTQEVKSTFTKFNVPAFDGLIYEPSNNSDPMMINHNGLIPYLIGAVQELTKQNNELKHMINDINEKINTSEFFMI